jgi:hypothetical protein
MSALTTHTHLVNKKKRKQKGNKKKTPTSDRKPRNAKNKIT